jgi:hypothetical protein
MGPGRQDVGGAAAYGCGAVKASSEIARSGGGRELGTHLGGEEGQRVVDKRNECLGPGLFLSHIGTFYFMKPLRSYPF